MITQDKLEKQIRRMAGLDNFPTFAPEAEGELVIMAARVARSEAHLVGVIDEIMAAWTKCPKPAELRALLDRDREEKVNPDCRDCHGSGWKIRINQAGESGAGRCQCGSVPRPPGEAPYSDKQKSGHSSTLEKVTAEDLIH